MFILIPPVYSTKYTIPYSEQVGVIVDGIISENEYSGSFHDDVTNIKVHWVHNGTHLFLGLVNNGTGWVAIGLGPSGIEMDGSNILIGSVNENQTNIVDEIGIGRRHFPDVSRGGSDDIIQSAGQVHNNTVLEFIVLLSSGDRLDHSFLTNNTYGFFLAYHELSSDISVYHTGYSNTYDVTIAPGFQVNEPSSFISNFSLTMVAIILVISVGIVVYQFRNRLKVYRFNEMGRN